MSTRTNSSKTADTNKHNSRSLTIINKDVGSLDNQHTGLQKAHLT